MSSCPQAWSLQTYEAMVEKSLILTLSGELAFQHSIPFMKVERGSVQLPLLHACDHPAAEQAAFSPPPPPPFLTLPFGGRIQLLLTSPVLQEGRTHLWACQAVHRPPRSRWGSSTHCTWRCPSPTWRTPSTGLHHPHPFSPELPEHTSAMGRARIPLNP